MKFRLELFLLSCLFSSIGIFFSAHLILTFFIDLFSGQVTDDKIYITFSIASLYALAWFFYFLISFNWVKYNVVPLKLKLIGSIFGLFAVLMTLGIGVLFTLPSVLLMLYICFGVPSVKSNA